MRHSSGDVQSAADGPARFVEDRPADIHDERPKPWHRYAYHIRMLAEMLETLAGELPASAGTRILDYGCADVPYRRFFPDHVEYAAADLPGNDRATVQLSADGTVPLPDESFDAVMSTQVLEHVTDPALYLSECFRVLRPGGRMLLSTHGTFVYHPDPDDYWRWTCAGLQKVVADAGLAVIRFEGVLGGIPTGLQLVQDAIYWKIPRAARPLLATLMQWLIALTDKLQSDGSRRLNAQVYVLVAEKP